MWGWALIAVGTIAAVTFLAVIATRPVPVSTTAGTIPPPKSSQQQPKLAPFAPFDETAAKLRQPGPVTIAVVGDSTGNAEDEWVYLTAARISQVGNRPVVIHNWSVAENAYTSERTVGSGTNAPVEIWNGSASGEGYEYSIEHWRTLTPTRPDILIVSHGHNIQSGSAAVVGMDRLLAKARTSWGPLPAVAVILQNPRTDENEARQDAVVDQIREQATANPEDRVELIDVYAAYGTDTSTLVNRDGFHPNAAGSRVYAATVNTALGL